jgi:hypothetical protein
MSCRLCLRSEYVTYGCDATGWTWTGVACGPTCQRSGSGPGNRPVTVACGRSVCGFDYVTCACNVDGWTSRDVSCGS